MCQRLLGETLEAPSLLTETWSQLSHAPVWHKNRLASRALVLRAFLATDGRGDYKVMAGGLARIAAQDSETVSGQRGGGSKDTWILSDSTDSMLLEWLLDLSDSLITYRARHLHHPEWPLVVDLLLFDPRNPRSGVFQLAKLAKHARLLPGAEASDLTGLVTDIEQRLATRLSDDLTLRYFSHVYELPRATV